MTDILSIHIERSEGGMFFVTCDQHRGLLTGEHTLAGALASVIPALRDLLAAGPPHPDPHAFDGIDVNAEPTEDASDETVVERVARAICAAYGDDFDEQPADLETLREWRRREGRPEGREVMAHDPGLPTQADWKECAVAAIAAKAQKPTQ